MYEFIGQKPKTVNVPDDIKQRVRDRVQWCLDQFSEDLPFPNIRYDKRGTTAGTANPSKNEIDLNSVLLMENVDDFIDRIVGHETAHLIAEQLYKGIKPHGAEWKSVMRHLGLLPERCHRYDTTNSRVRRIRPRATYAYICACGKEYRLGATRHRRHVASGGKRYCCRKCKAYLLLKP